MLARVASILSMTVLLAGATASGAIAETTSESPLADQGSSYHYRSNITAVTPHVTGLSVQIQEFADRLLVTNHTGRTVTIYGYQSEPYARILANGTAEQNTRSPAVYLNTTFYGNVTVPASANPNAPPQWTVVDRTGQFEWHDHRIHWNSPLLPPAVKDKAKRTFIFEWHVPIAVGASTGAITGQLFWTPESSSAPVAAIIVGILIVLALIAFAVLVRRRRRREAAPAVAAAGGGQRPDKEAW